MLLEWIPHPQFWSAKWILSARAPSFMQRSPLEFSARILVVVVVPVEDGILFLLLRLLSFLASVVFFFRGMPPFWRLVVSRHKLCLDHLFLLCVYNIIVIKVEVRVAVAVVFACPTTRRWGAVTGCRFCPLDT